MNKLEFTVEQIASLVKGSIEGDKKLKINTISSIEEGEKGSISFLSNPKYEPYVYTSCASAIIVDKHFKKKKPINSTLIRVENAYNSFTILLEECSRIFNYSKTGIEQPSYVSSETTLPKDMYLGAFAYIGKHVVLGKNVQIYPNTYIGDYAHIGNNTIIYSGVKIYPRVKIGNFCTIHAGAVVGSDGFGFAPQTDGTYKNIPQLGNVILEDYVNIGANTTIDRATFKSTIIEKGVKLDNLVQIGHNVRIGKNTVVAAQTGIAGSVNIGNQVIIAGQAGIVGHVKIEDNVIIAAKAGIMNNVPKGATLAGYFAKDKNQCLKLEILYRKLPQMLQRIEKLEKNS